MQNLEIGVAVMTYDEDGKVLSAEFSPKIKASADVELLKELNSIPVDSIKESSTLVLASWFNRMYEVMDEIELADRSNYEVYAEVIETTEHTNGKIKSCSTKFIFKELTQKTP